MFEKKKDKLIILITELMKLTIKKELNWENETPPKQLTTSTDASIPVFFTTEYKNKKIGIFTRKYQNYSMEFDEMYWTEENKIAILDDEQVLWENKQHSNAVNDLFYHVQEQVSGLNDLLDELVD